MERNRRRNQWCTTVTDSDRQQQIVTDSDRQQQIVTDSDRQ
jgi:hypothetical protein